MSVERHEVEKLLTDYLTEKDIPQRKVEKLVGKVMKRIDKDLNKLNERPRNKDEPKTLPNEDWVRIVKEVFNILTNEIHFTKRKSIAFAHTMVLKGIQAAQGNIGERPISLKAYTDKIKNLTYKGNIKIGRNTLSKYFYGNFESMKFPPSKEQKERLHIVEEKVKQQILGCFQGNV